MRSLALCALLASAACSGSDGISHFRIAGETAIPESDLRAGAETCPDARTCALELEMQYLRMGYLDVSVSPSRTRLEDWMGARGGTLTIVEGLRFTFGPITIVEAGAHASTPLDGMTSLADAANVRAGTWFHAGSIQDLMRKIEAHYQGAGYVDAWVMTSTSVDTNTKSASVSFVIDRGVRSSTPN